MNPTAESHQRLLSEVSTQLAPDMLSAIVARIDALVAGAPTESVSGPVDAFTEQYVIDAYGVTDELCAELIATVGEDQATALTFAVAVHEAEARRRAVLG